MPDLYLNNLNDNLSSLTPPQKPKQPLPSKKSDKFEILTGTFITLFTIILVLTGLLNDNYNKNIISTRNTEFAAQKQYDSANLKQILVENQRDTLEALLVSGELKANTITDIKNNLDKLDDLVDVNNAKIKKLLILVEEQNTEQGKVTPENINQEEFWRTFGALQALLNSQELSTTAKENLEKYLELLNEKITKYKQEKNELLLGSNNIPAEEWINKTDNQLGKIAGTQELQQKTAKLNQANSKTQLASLFLAICLFLGAVSLIFKKQGAKGMFLSLMIIIGLIGTGFMIWGMTIVWPF